MAFENLETLKAQLEERKISYSLIGNKADADKGTVSKVLRGIYTGSDDTKKRIINTCHALLEEKPLSIMDDILSNSTLYEKLMLEATLLRVFTPEQREYFTKIYKELKKYNKRKKTSKRKQIN